MIVAEVTAGRQGLEGNLARQRRTARTVCPRVFKNQVKPLFDKGRGRIPVERMLKYNNIVALTKSLLVRNIDKKIRITRIEIVESNPLEVLYRLSFYFF